MRGLLADRNARLYLLGQAFSLFGDSALWLAMGIWVKTLTHSNGAAGLVFFFFTAPALLAPAAGLAVDRVRRRPLLIAANGCAGAAVLLLLLVRGPGQVWLIYLVMALYGFLYIVLGAAQSALLMVMLPSGLLPDANAALRTIQESLRLVTPLAGAGLFVLAGPHVVAITDAATFAVPVACLAAIHLSEPPPQRRAARWRAEVTAGLRHLWRTAALRQLVTAAACAVTVFGFAETAIYAIAGQGLHEPPTFVGVLVAVQGAGAIAGGLTAAPLLRRAGEIRLAGIGLTAIAVAAALAMPPLLASVVPGLVLFGAGLPWLVVGATTLMQRCTPPHLQGRVYAAAETLITTPQAISIATGAALIGIAGYRTLLAALAAVTGLAAAYLFTRPTADPGEPLAAYAMRDGGASVER